MPQEVNRFGCTRTLSGFFISVGHYAFTGTRGAHRHHSAWVIRDQKLNGSYNHVGMYGYNFSFDSLISAQNIYGPGSPTETIAFWPNQAAEVGNKVAEAVLTNSKFDFSNYFPEDSSLPIIVMENSKLKVHDLARQAIMGKNDPTDIFNGEIDG